MTFVDILFPFVNSSQAKTRALSHLPPISLTKIFGYIILNKLYFPSDLWSRRYTMALLILILNLMRIISVEIIYDDSFNDEWIRENLSLKLTSLWNILWNWLLLYLLLLLYLFLQDSFWLQVISARRHSQFEHFSWFKTVSFGYFFRFRENKPSWLVIRKIALFMYNFTST